ncbi:MAG: CdaR family protein, partial [Bryobacteraceae bacterium]
GFKVERYEIDPPTLRVAGPAELVKQVTGAQTDALNLSTTEHDADFRVNTFVADSQVRLDSPPIVKVHVVVVPSKP